jgi:hypothetical protein
MTMTNKTVQLYLTGLAFMLSSVVFGQPSVEKIPIPLTDPNRPMFLKVGLISGGIVVKGYAGKEVIVEATTQPQDDEDRPEEKTAGKLKLIPNTSIGLTAEEEDNTVSVSTGLRGITRQIDLVIQVPAACSMKLSTVNGGDIEVENVNGDLEVNNTNGSITLKKIAGSAVAQTVNGEVKVEFTRVNADKAMSFSSLNGDVDVTFPASLKATVQLKSEQGEIYSDFDVLMQKTEARVDKNEKGKGKYRVTVEKAMRGTINGGGQEIQFNNFNGSIYIRKGG